MKHAQIVQQFIDEVWNRQSFEMMNRFLHADFTDHSLIPALPPNMEGTRKWIVATGKAFEHQTFIEEQVTEADQTMIRIKMQLKHIGVWRGIEPTGTELFTTGFRQFTFQDGKIIGHWALIDGETIENKLKDAAKGCSVSK